MRENAYKNYKNGVLFFTFNPLFSFM